MFFIIQIRSTKIPRHFEFLKYTRHERNICNLLLPWSRKSHLAICKLVPKLLELELPCPGIFFPVPKCCPPIMVKYYTFKQRDQLG